MNILQASDVYKKQVIGQEFCKEILQDISQYIKLGISELELYDIAKTIIKNNNRIQGIWHPIVIKFDQSTLIPGVKHKPDASIQYNEIAIIDIGIIVDGIELDYAQTFGTTDEAKRLINTTDKVLNDFVNLLTTQKMPPHLAFKNLCEIAANNEVMQIADTAGHLLGVFPTMKNKVKISSEQSDLTSIPFGSWMLEVHLSNSRIASFKEELVYIPEKLIV